MKENRKYCGDVWTLDNDNGTHTTIVHSVEDKCWCDIALNYRGRTDETHRIWWDDAEWWDDDTMKKFRASTQKEVSELINEIMNSSEKISNLTVIKLPKNFFIAIELIDDEKQLDF